jgi:hypothetical protein
MNSRVFVRRFRFVVLMLSGPGGLAGCASWTKKLPPSTAEALNDYGYHPIDPLPVKVSPAKAPNEMILNGLPDETMRLAIGEVMADGSVSYGPAKAGYKGRAYLVVLDYIKFDTKSFGVRVSTTNGASTIDSVLPPDSYAQFRAAPLPSGADDWKKANPSANSLVPTYVGVGLRLTASVTVNEGSIDLGNLIALGAAAHARQVSGTLVVQTLGISGPTISPLVPMPSEISESTIQNAILSLGAIKARLYDEHTEIHPRVVGVYNNLGGGAKTINSFISTVLEHAPELVLSTALAASPP